MTCEINDPASREAQHTQSDEATQRPQRATVSDSGAGTSFETTRQTYQHTRNHWCGGRRRDRRARAGTHTKPRPIGGRRVACGAWPGFEPTRRAKLAARTASGRAGHAAAGNQAAARHDGARNTSGATRCGDGGNRTPVTRHSKRGRHQPAPCASALTHP